MKDYRVKVSVRNNRILRKMEEEGIGSIKALSDLAGLDQNTVGMLVRMEASPLRKDGVSITKAALAIMAALNATFNALSDIGRRLDVTPERVRQIELRSLRRLRSRLCKDGVGFHDLLPDDISGSVV